MRFFTFLAAVGEHWFFWIGLALVIEPFLEGAFPPIAACVKRVLANDRRKILFRTLGVIGLIFAFFQAWNTQYEIVQETENRGRSFTDTEVSALTVSLFNIKSDLIGHDRRVLLCWPQNDSEAANYRNALAGIFSTAGMFADSCGVTPDGPEDTGISIRVRDKNSPPSFIAELKEAFRAGNIDAPILGENNNSPFKENREILYYILVGPRPIKTR